MTEKPYEAAPFDDEAVPQSEEMPQEELPEREQEVIKLSQEEYDKYMASSLSPDDPELKEWMEQKGLALDSGDVEVEIDGERHFVSTNRETFGSFVDEDLDLAA